MGAKSLLGVALSSPTSAPSAAPTTSAPTPVPSIAPTGYSCRGVNNGTCLDIYMYDFYGDGWDGAEVFVEYPDGTVKSDAPNCVNRSVYHELCTNRSGLHYFTAIHPNESYIPDNSWEVMWIVSNKNCNNRTVHYTGGYNTTMVWDYEDGIWSLVHWENLWANEKECDPCGDASRCKPKKPKKKSNKKKKVKKSNDDTDETDTTSSNSTNSSSGKKAKRYGPPAVNVRVTMFDEEGDGWWQNDYLGASWYIATDDRKSLFFTGTLCHWYRGYCNVCLGDGAYTIRFTGTRSNESNFTAWDFCGVTGGYSMELSFHIKKGKCIPDALTTLETGCFGTVNSTVTLRGVLALGGLTSEVFNMADSQVVTRTLARTVRSWSANRISIVSTALDTVSFSNSESRRLSSFTHDVTFEVQFESEITYGIDGRDFALLNQLVEDLSDQLEESISTGAFQVALTNRATLAGVTPLAQIQQVELLSLEVETVTYVGVEELRAGSLPSTYSESDEDSDSVLHRYDKTTIVLFFSAMAVGFVAFVGILSNGTRQYQSLPMDSTHYQRETDSSLEISRTDMDSTISNPLGGNAARDSNIGAVSSTL